MGASTVYKIDDLQAILQGIALTADMLSADQEPHAAAFRRGFKAALAAVATSIHIDIGSAPERDGERVRVVWPELESGR